MCPRTAAPLLPAAVLLLATGVAACAATPPRPAQARSGVEAAGPRHEILRAAAAISSQHVTATDRGALILAAAQALEAAAGARPGAGGAPAAAAGAPEEALDGALGRLRAARPDLSGEATVGLAVEGMTALLQDGSRYIGPEEFRRSFSGKGPPETERGIVGFHVKRGERWPVVFRLVPDSPAAAAGLPLGSELRAVDDRSTEGLSLDEVTGLLRGLVGSLVRLTIGPPGGPGRELSLQRDAIDPTQMDCRVLDGAILYLQVPALLAGTKARVLGWAGAPGTPARAVILDLRGDAGGRLDAAADLADVFLESGTILSIEGRDPKLNETKRASPGTSALERAEVAVLVDGKTSSGAEAVAAALQDLRRGTVVGAPTAARASIDLVAPVGGGAIRLPVARLRRGGGEPIDGRGVTPDVPVAADASPPARPVSDVPCPAFASAGPVASDPVVARAVAVLRGR